MRVPRSAAGNYEDCRALPRTRAILFAANNGREWMKTLKNDVWMRAASGSWVFDGLGLLCGFAINKDGFEVDKFGKESLFK